MTLYDLVLSYWVSMTRLPEPQLLEDKCVERFPPPFAMFILDAGRRLECLTGTNQYDCAIPDFLLDFVLNQPVFVAIDESIREWLRANMESIRTIVQTI